MNNLKNYIGVAINDRLRDGLNKYLKYRKTTHIEIFH